MGLYDTVRSSYDLGPEFTNVGLQTKDIDCAMSDYWLSPAGQLYLIDYSHTVNFVEITQDDPEYSEKLTFLNFKWVPNGNHGKIGPCYITKYVEVYPSGWKGKLEQMPRCILHFRNGVLQDYEVRC